VILPGDVDFGLELTQDGGQAPQFVLGRYPSEGEVNLTVGQARALRDALSEALRMVANQVG
jgi:hypothetical protein